MGIENIIFWLEILGTIIFALSGTLVAIEKKLDVLGVTVLALVTAVGGGLIRDILLGSFPANVFKNPIYSIVALVTSLVLFFTILFMKKDSLEIKPIYKTIIDILDAIGLGVFVIVGVNIAITSGFADNAFLSIFVGVCTGVGGGLIRDVLVNNVPMILSKRVYAFAAIIGAFSYFYLFTLNLLNKDHSIFIGIIIIVVIRLLAMKYKWYLPRIK